MTMLYINTYKTVRQYLRLREKCSENGMRATASVIHACGSSHSVAVT